MQTNPTVARLDRVSKRYGKLLALDEVSLDIRSGELLALLGPNGAGKTTAIGLLLGLLQPDSGSVSLFEQDPAQLAARRRIGVMLQSASMPETLRVGELVRLTASYYPNPRPLGEVAELAGIGALLKRPYGKLSGGQQRRVQLALAACGNPELLFLDEPTTGMDIDARERVWRAMRDLVASGCGVVLTTHYLEEAQALAQRVVVLGKGKVLSDGSVDELRARVAISRIRCHSKLALAQVSAWPGVQQACTEAGKLVVTTSSAEDVLKRLLAADPGLSGIEVERAGLAEAFTELTRETQSEEEAA